MKNLIKEENMRFAVFILITLFHTSLIAQGIEFFKGTYPEAKLLAEKENKNIFVDAYTTWCGPCKKMVRETFSDPYVGRYFKENFIALQLDAENESESEFFKEFTATAFPSLFWLDKSGDLMDMQIGFLDAEGFIKATKLAAENNLMNEFRMLQERWNNEERNFNLYQKYTSVAYKVKPKLSRSIAEEYISGLTKDDLLSLNTFKVLQSFTREADNSIFFDLLIENWDTYMKKVDSPEDSWSRLYSTLVRYASIYRNDKDMEGYNRQIKLIENLNFKHSTLFLDSVKLENLIFDKHYSEAINEMLRLTEKYSDKAFLYDNYYYTLILSGYFLNEGVNLEEAEKLITFTRKNAKIKATQKSMLYMASAYAYKKDYKTAYEYLASLGFYPQPMLSNALYSKLNLPVPRSEFPW